MECEIRNTALKKLVGFEPDWNRNTGFDFIHRDARMRNFHALRFERVPVRASTRAHILCDFMRQN
jgi:hypothetical protein